MNVSSLSGLSGSTALSLLQSTASSTASSTSSSASAETRRKDAPPPPPPPRSASGGADAKSLFDALAESNDANGDGLLSQDEIDAAPMAGLLSSQFSTIDSDADGLLSETELSIAETALRSGEPTGASGKGMTAEMGGPPPGGPPPPGGSNSATDAQSLYESLFDALSHDESGGSSTVTRDEDLAQRFLSLLSEIA